MSIYKTWRGVCDCCDNVGTSGHSRAYVILELMKVGWSVVREANDSGNETYYLTCPKCVDFYNQGPKKEKAHAEE